MVFFLFVCGFLGLIILIGPFLGKVFIISMCLIFGGLLTLGGNSWETFVKLKLPVLCVLIVTILSSPTIQMLLGESWPYLWRTVLIIGSLCYAGNYLVLNSDLLDRFTTEPDLEDLTVDELEKRKKRQKLIDELKDQSSEEE